jgi:hypothetical protein
MNRSCLPFLFYHKYTIMNKLFLAIAVVACTQVSISAQQTTPKKYQFYVNMNSSASTLGRRIEKLPQDNLEALDALIWIGSFGTITAVDNNQDDVIAQSQQGNSGAYTVGFRQDFGVKGNWRWGANWNQRSYTSTHKWESGRITTNKDNFTTLEAEIACYWAKSPYIDVYSGFALGRTWQTATGYKRYEKSYFSSHLSLLGIQVHYRNVGLNFEGGIGNRGPVSAGLAVKF